jgi:hypothetical protein
MKFLRITGFLLIYLLLCSKGCDDREEKSPQLDEAKVKKAYDSILLNFRTDILPESSLRAFEENAKQKLADFADYFNIVIDTSLDTSFRHQAAKMIREIFYRDNLQLQLTLPGKMETQAITLDELMSHSFLSGYGKPGLILDSICISDHIHSNGSSGYTGKISFRQGFTGISEKDQIFINPTPKEVILHLNKHPKQFGSDVRDVWELSLGQIENSKIQNPK